MIKTNIDLVEELKLIVKNINTVYAWGMFGMPITEKNIKQKAFQYKYGDIEVKNLHSLINKGYFGFDCVCLYKALLWGWNGNHNHVFGGATYASNGVPDLNANQMFKICKNKSVDFTKIQAGEILWTEGHFGIYIGDGLAIEATPRWKGGVQISTVANIGENPNYPSRKWLSHGLSPHITYKEYSDRNKSEFILKKASNNPLGWLYLLDSSPKKEILRYTSKLLCLVYDNRNSVKNENYVVILNRLQNKEIINSCQAWHETIKGGEGIVQYLGELIENVNGLE